MLREKVSRVVISGGWGAASELVGMALRFFTLPILLAFYGRKDYGLIAIVMAVQAYLAMLSLGTPDGLVKYAAEWLHCGNVRDLQLCARTSFTFYAFLGLSSGIILAIVGASCSGLFHVSGVQAPILRNMFILAGTVGFLISPSALITQLLKAAEEFQFLSKRAIVISALDMCWVLWAVYCRMRLDYFLGIRLLIPLLTLPALLRRWSRHGSLSGVLRFGWHWTAFRPVMNYGLSIMAMGWAYNSFFQLRQVLLGARSTTSAVAEFSILFAMTNVLSMAGKWIVGPLIPSMAKAMVGGDVKYVDFVAYRMTKYFGIMLCLPTLCIMVNAESILRLYVGQQFVGLAPWLVLMMLCVIDTFLAPLSGIIFAKGKLRAFVWSNAVLCMIGVALVWILAPRLGALSAVLATLWYYGLNYVFHFIYYIPRVMKLDSWRVFRASFIAPLLPGVLTAIVMIGARDALRPASSWGTLALTISLGVPCYLILVWVMSLDKTERQMLRKALGALPVWRRRGNPPSLVPGAAVAVAVDSDGQQRQKSL